MKRIRRWKLLTLSTALVVGAAWAPAAGTNLLPGSCDEHLVLHGCVSSVTGRLLDPQRALPDLVPDTGEVFVARPFIWDEETQSYFEGPEHLYFDTLAQNLGQAPFDIIADDPTNFGTSTVSQCVAWTGPVCRERRQIGGFEWHEEHHHYHYLDFAAYAVRRLGPDGLPDYSAAGLVSSSDKVSFCLVDSKQVDPNASPVPSYPVLCTPTRQGISPGWADLYDYGTPGQQLSLEGLTDGRYALILSTDPADHVFESNNDNNVVEVTFELSNNLSEVRIVSKRWP